ncbi:transporter [Burkholderia cenocepacia]|nr:transporter [Burkholderia cenocepacia]PNE63491.1 transporter [Burkholderia cenocepacia]
MLHGRRFIEIEPDRDSAAPSCLSLCECSDTGVKLKSSVNLDAKLIQFARNIVSRQSKTALKEGYLHTSFTRNILFGERIMKGFAAKVAILLVTTITLIRPASAVVLETDPADYVALPQGVNLALLYYQHANSTAAYSSGNRVDQPFHVQSDIGIARFIHYGKLFGFTVTPQIILPFGSVRMSEPASLRSNGIGDPFVGSAIWLINDPASQRYLSLAAFVSLPLGTYDANQGGLNIGAHRWSEVTHLNYSQRVYGPLFLDVTGEFAFYSTNHDYAGQRYWQAPTFDLQTHLRYEIDSRTRVAFSYYHTAGGRTELDGNGASGSLSTDTYLVTFARFLTPTFQVQLQAGQDIHVSNGPKNKLRLNLRMAKAF